MAKNVGETQVDPETKLRQDAARVAGETQQLGKRMKDSFKGRAAEVIGEIGHEGITEQSANPLTAGLSKNKALAADISKNLLDIESRALETEQTGIKAAKEAKDAGTTAVSAAMSTISSAKTRLEGFGRWMTDAEKAEFRVIVDNAIAGLTPTEQTQVRNAFSEYL